jgi:hypothetical protein
MNHPGLAGIADSANGYSQVPCRLPLGMEEQAIRIIRYGSHKVHKTTEYKER